MKKSLCYLTFILMEIKHRIRSNNYDNNTVIEVEFLVIHATMCSWQKTKEIFENPDTEVSSHIVIDVHGNIDEIVPCLNGKALKAWHAGQSKWIDDGGRSWEWFNGFSLGIELENIDCFSYGYTELQYEALFWITKKIQNLYPKLQSRKRVVGHEHIAKGRKFDPGMHFDWIRFFLECYSNKI